MTNPAASFRGEPITYGFVMSLGGVMILLAEAGDGPSHILLDPYRFLGWKLAAIGIVLCGLAGLLRCRISRNRKISAFLLYGSPVAQRVTDMVGGYWLSYKPLHSLYLLTMLAGILVGLCSVLSE